LQPFVTPAEREREKKRVKVILDRLDEHVGINNKKNKKKRTKK